MIIGLSIFCISIIIILIWFILFVLSLKGKFNPHRFFNNKLYEDFEHNTVPDKELPQVYQGLEKASQSKIILVGLARDNEERISKNIENMVKIGKHFDDYRIVIFENDSSDNTREIIEQKSHENSKIELIECQDIPQCKFGTLPAYGKGLFSKGRIVKMSEYRNMYMTYIYNKYKNWDYLFICDMDMEGVFFKNGFFHALNLTKEYSAVFSNGMMSVPGLIILSPYDGMAYSTEHMKENKAAITKFFHQLKTCKYSSKPIEVHSAFNGGGIYRLSDVYPSMYNADYSCEHNSLHYAMREKGKRLCIDPYFMVYAGMQGHF
jgi:hypothetical protein